jgi:hypothetical protein
MFVVKGIKGWIVTLVALAVIITAIVLIFQLLLFLIPLILIIVIVSYLFRMLNKLKKGEPNNYIDVKYKVKK